MRQAGLIAAPALLALENVDRLATDHDNADRLAAGLDAVAGLRAPTPDTNIVQVHTGDLAVDAATFVDACEAVDVRGGAHGPSLTRFYTHLDVDSADVDAAIDRVERAVASL